jgi:putative phosphoesterase
MKGPTTMSKIGVMSDTHGNIQLMNSVADMMVNKFHCDIIIHLGDDIADLKDIDTHGARLIGVPGIYEGAWFDGKTPHRIIENIDGTVFFISHTPTRSKSDKDGDIAPEDARKKYKADALLYGHTHKRFAGQRDDGLIMINPGHLKDISDRGDPATFAIITSVGEVLLVEHFGLDGNIVDNNKFILHRPGPYLE